MAIGTALTVAGIATTTGTTALSFAQASKDRRLQEEAKREAAKAFAEAKRSIDVNFYDQLAIQKEPYTLEREANAELGAGLTQAGIESERGAAATAGRVQLAQQIANRNIAAAMGAEMNNLDKLSAVEDASINTKLANLSLDEAAGAQLANRDATEARATALTNAFTGVSSLTGQLAKLPGLYASLSSDPSTVKTPQAQVYTDQNGVKYTAEDLAKKYNIDINKVKTQ